MAGKYRSNTKDGQSVKIGRCERYGLNPSIDRRVNICHPRASLVVGPRFGVCGACGCPSVSLVAVKLQNTGGHGPSCLSKLVVCHATRCTMPVSFRTSDRWQHPFRITSIGANIADAAAIDKMSKRAVDCSAPKKKSRPQATGRQ